MTPNFILLYVADPLKSAEFYASLLGKEPVESSPGFALFIVAPGLKLGLWLKTEIIPPATLPGGFELGWPVDSNAMVDQLSKDWIARGIPVIQQPEDMDFGRTFTALDPDGHRLRVFAPGA
jgi:catechol 2,3-dioxygenase-like lactoylglutathione lyase family enzyme